jgi:hypothetical protein
LGSAREPAFLREALSQPPARPRAASEIAKLGSFCAFRFARLTWNIREHLSRSIVFDADAQGATI